MAKRKAQKASRQRPARELPPVGTELVGRYHGEEISALVVADEARSGLPAVECRSTRHRSLSAAARAVTGNSVNGWRFWQVVEPPQGESA